MEIYLERKREKKFALRICWKGFVLAMCVVGGWIKKKRVIEAVIYDWWVHSLPVEKMNEKRCLDGKK